MPEVSYDGRSFIIGRRRIWIVGGAVHYFRVPRGLWRDRLLKLKRAGCNTLDTYVAWNYHESREGHFDFEGERDLDAFLSLAEDLGLWIIVRPGPYICAEWDNGGLPAWLNIRDSIALRTANAAYHECIRRWWEVLIPIIARRQVTRGGRVLLVQSENEYIFRNRPGGREHLEFCSGLLAHLGIEVPIISCNFGSEKTPGAIECWNGWENPDRAVDALSRVQPGAPKLITEFWDGCFRVWGHGAPLAARSAREVHANSLLASAHGAMYSYYMFHGGTNFNAWPGRANGAADYYITTSYDYDAPVSETGALTDKYYAAGLASTLASNLESFFAESEPASWRARAGSGVETLARRGPQGHIVFVFNRSGRAETELQLPGGVKLQVSFRDCDALALPYNFSPVPGFTIDYSNLSLLGQMAMGVGKLVFLYGPRESEAVLSAGGRLFRRGVSREAQVWFGNFPNLLAVMNTHQAERTWFMDDRIVVGPCFAGEADGEQVKVGVRGDSGNVVTYFPNGKVNYAAAGPAPSAPRPPTLARWQKTTLMPSGVPQGAERIDDGRGGFAPPESLGYTGGYGWYHTTVESKSDRTTRLLFADAEDRLTVFVNGTRSGTYGRGDGATTSPVDIKLRKGANDLHVLLDNLGRAHYTLALGEKKGLRQGVFLDSRVLRLERKWTSGGYDGRLAHTWQMESFWSDAREIAATLSIVFKVKKGEGAVLRLSDVDQPAALFINRNFHSYYWGREALSRLDMVLEPEMLSTGRNLIELGFFVKPPRRTSRAVKVLAYEYASAVKGPWHFASLEAPTFQGGAPRAAPGTPAAWRTTFDCSGPPGPLVLVCEGLEKGEVWLNGRNVGRHWKIGPERRVYLPEPYIEKENTLIVVDESCARMPSSVRLEYDEAALMHLDTV